MKGWRTFALGAATVFLSFLVGLTPEALMFIGNNWPWATGVIGIAVVILRAVTTSPIFKKDDV